MFNIGHWQPKIADPSFIGWFTVFSYYLCAGLGVVHLLKTRTRINGTDSRLDRRFRIAMTVTVFLLGLGKHFNLPAAITEIGRIVANQIGGYELRRGLQVCMLCFVAIGVFLVIRWSTSHRLFRGLWKRRAPEIICLFFLCGLVILRAISLHAVGALLATEVFGVRLNRVAELTAVHSLIVILLIRMIPRGGRADSVP